MKIENISDLKKYFGEQPIPQDINELSKEKPLRITIDILNRLYDYGVVNEQDYADTFAFLMGNDINILEKYKAKNVPVDVIKALTNRGTFDKKMLQKLNSVRYGASRFLYNSIFKIIVSTNPQLIDYYTFEQFDVCRVALEHGAKIDAKSLISEFLLRPVHFLSDDDKKFIFNYIGIISIDINALRAYAINNDAIKLLLSFDKVNYVLEALHIDRNIFIQWSFASKYSWLEDILIIYNQNKVMEFAKVYNKLVNCYYNLNEKSPNILRIKALLDTLKNYNKYRELCANIVDEELSEEDINRLKILFNNQDVIKRENGEPITSKDELSELDIIIFKKYKNKVDNLSIDSDLTTLKEVFCDIMLNMLPHEVEEKIKRYGSVQTLKQMLFDNQNNEELFGDILEMITYVAFMEDVYRCENHKEIIKILNTIVKSPEAYEQCAKCRNLFVTFDDKMRRLYAKELSANLTNLNNIPSELINKEFTDKYGIETITLTNSKYLLAYHTLSVKEKIDDLVNGIANGTQSIVSLTLAGSRNQNIFKDDRMIVATDIVPEELFIFTATNDVCSNGCVRNYNCDIDTSRIKFRSRGAYEISASFVGSCPETVVYREGLKFKYIILPGGRAPTEEELECAHKYDMKFVITEELKRNVKNPKPIPKTKKPQNIEPISSHKKELEQMREFLVNNKEKTSRKIAIFANANGVYESTLAILEAIRKQGITEIYSLGDNIGLGPTPKEVMDLLSEYNVKSLRGDQELSVLGLTDTIKGYLEKDGRYKETVRNSLWTRNQLTDEQIERIKSFPERMIIKIGGKKIMLSHYVKDYNTETLLDIPKGVTNVFQSHTYIEDNGSKIIAIPQTNNGIANFIVIEEKPNGGFDINSCNVNFNPKQTQYDIIESDLPDEDKDIMSNLVNGR